MRRAVLTAGEVSVLASMAIVVLCTTALFLSGYAIQQRTLRDLRAAIRPREPRPRAHLPDRFRSSDPRAGSLVVAVAAAAGPPAQQPAEPGQEAAVPAADAPQPAGPHASAEARSRAVVAALAAQAAAKAWAVEHPDPAKRGRIAVTRAERRRLIKDEIRRLAQPERLVYRRLW